MISIFLHLLVLAYGTVNLAGYLQGYPLTFLSLWFFATFAILLHLLPQYIDDQIDSLRIPPFSTAQNLAQWFIVAWIILLHATSDPVRLILPSFSHLQQTLPMIGSLILYVCLSRPVYFELFRLFKPILDDRQNNQDFFRARMTIPILFFPPIMMWMLLEDLTTKQVNAFTEVKMLALAPFFFIFLYLLAPKLFNWAWKAEANTDPELDKMVMEISQKAQTPVSGVKIWNTFNEPIPNAAVAGLSARYRFVYMTRFLLELFSPQQIKGVIAHEMAHLRLGHVGTYMTYSINLVLISVTIKLANIIYFPQWIPDSTSATIIELLIFVAVFALSFTALARHCEYQADAFACSLTGSQGLAGGLETLNQMVMPPPKFIPEWLLTHPPIQDRIDRARMIVSTDIKPFVRKAAGIRKALVATGLIMLLVAAIPAKSAFKVADLQQKIQSGKVHKALSLYENLPDWLKVHPVVLIEKGRLSASRNSWILTTLVAIEATWGLKFCSLEVFHHSGAPEVALDLKVVKFILQTLDLG